MSAVTSSRPVRPYRHEADPPHRPRGAPARSRRRLDAVIRGEVVPESRYPWLVDMLSCGGTLIAPDRVLTAAHCLIADRGFRRHHPHRRRGLPRRAAADGPPPRPPPGLRQHGLGADGALRPRGARARRAGHGHRAAAGRRERPEGGRAGDDPRARARGASSGSTSRTRPTRYRDAGAAARHGQADDRLRRRVQEVLRDQPLQARLLRPRGHDLLARSAARSRAAPRARRGPRSAWATAAGR